MLSDTNDYIEHIDKNKIYFKNENIQCVKGTMLQLNIIMYTTEDGITKIQDNIVSCL